MSRKLIVSSVAVSFALGILAVAGIFVGAEIDLGQTGYVVTDYGPELALFALAGGAVLGARDVSTYETYELAAVAVAVAVPAAVYADVTQVTDMLNSYHPYSGLAVAAIGFIGYHAVTFAGSSSQSVLGEN